MIETFIHRNLVIEYEVKGEGQPLVFLHGLGGSMEQIYGTYDEIAGIQLITLNQQGHGNSDVDWKHFDFDHLADDVIALLDHLGIGLADFAGISMGAAVILNLALRYPERVKSLTLIRNAWVDMPMNSHIRKAYRDLGNSLKENSKDTFLRTVGWKLVEKPSEYTRNAFLLPFSEEFNIRNWQKYLILPEKFPVRVLEDLEKIRCEVCILAAKGDLCHPYEYGVLLHEMIPQSRFVEIPNKDEDKIIHKKMINGELKKSRLSKLVK